MAASYNGITLPSNGSKITYENGKLVFPDQSHHSLHRRRRHRARHLEGVGPGVRRRGRDRLRRQAPRGLVSKCSPAKKPWTASRPGCPTIPLHAFRDLRVGIKGPLTTPVGGGIRSLNVALRQILDLYACVRPVKYYQGIPSPVKHPERMNIVIYRENTEDVYAGIEWKEGHAAGQGADRLHQQQDAGRHQQADSRRFGHRHQADLHYRHQAPGAHGDRVCAEEQSASR